MSRAPLEDARLRHPGLGANAPGGSGFYRKEREAVKKIAWFLVVLVALLAGAASAQQHSKMVTYRLVGGDPADSLNGGVSVTTASVPCFGAKSVTFFVRDSVPATAYVDSFSTAQIQFSTDNVNWLTKPLTVVTPADYDSLVVVFAGKLLNVSMVPSLYGGYRVVKVTPTYGLTTGGPGFSQTITTVSYVRLNLVTKTRFASVAHTGDADMIGLRILAYVEFDGADPYLPNSVR